jgi:low affinity Fe/Cu permease
VEVVTKESFAKFAQWMARQSGKATAFIAAIVLLVIWAASGPLFGWSDTWQLIINTGTTIITFLMVFLIQNTQNRDTEALHLKLDELIRANKDVSDSAMDLENRSEEQLDARKAELLNKQRAPRRRRGEEEDRSRKARQVSSRPNRTDPDAPPPNAQD